VHEVIYLSPQQVVESSSAPGLTGGQSANVTDAQLSKGMQLLEGPFPDITDVLAYGSGAAAGWMVMGFFLPGADVTSIKTDERIV